MRGFPPTLKIVEEKSGGEREEGRGEGAGINNRGGGGGGPWRGEEKGRKKETERCVCCIGREGEIGRDERDAPPPNNISPIHLSEADWNLEFPKEDWTQIELTFSLQQNSLLLDFFSRAISSNLWRGRKKSRSRLHSMENVRGVPSIFSHYCLFKHLLVRTLIYEDECRYVRETVV